MKTLYIVGIHNQNNPSDKSVWGTHRTRKAALRTLAQAEKHLNGQGKFYRGVHPTYRTFIEKVEK